jgi:chromosomal replication initiation ATPase DnaA
MQTYLRDSLVGEPIKFSRGTRFFAPGQDYLAEHLVEVRQLLDAQLTITEVAARVRVSRSTLYTFMRQNGLTRHAKVFRERGRSSTRLEAVADLSTLSINPNGRLRISDVQALVCRRFGLTMAEMVGSRKTSRVAHPRLLAMALARELTRQSLPKIGDRFGNRDHTTVAHACNVVAERVKDKPDWADHYNALRAHLTMRPANDAEAA